MARVSIIAIAISFASLVPVVGAQSTIDTKTCVIRGRFVDAETGEPIPRCRVELTGHQSTGYDLAWSLGDWVNPPSVTTGADGAFRFAIRLPVSEGSGYRSRYHINATHIRTAPWFSTCSFRTVETTGSVDYGDIRVPVGVRPRIRVVDTEGRPQAGVRVTLRQKLESDPFSKNPSPGLRSMIRRGGRWRTDIDGYLHPQNPLPKGTYALELEKRKIKEAPQGFELPSPEVITVIVDKVAESDVIEGKVVDTAGLSVAGVMLAVKTHKGREWFYSRRDGRFSVRRPDGLVDDEARVMLSKNRRYDNWVDVARLQWGDRKAVIEIGTGTKVTFAVTSAEGTPVETFNLYCLPIDKRGVLTGVRRSGRFVGGRVRCRLAPGDYRVMVYPRGPGAVPTTWRQIEVGDKAATERIVLPTSLKRSIRVMVGDTPRAGVRVEVAYGMRPNRFGDLFAIQRVVGKARVPGSVLVAAAWTDAKGAIELRAPECDDGQVFVRVSGTGLQNSVHEVSAEWTRREVFAVQADPGATVRGVLGPIEDVDALDIITDDERKKSLVFGHLARLQLRRRPSILVFVGDATEPWSNHHYPVDEKGRFTISGLPPGKVRLGLRRFVRKSPTSTGSHPEVHEFGVFELSVSAPKVVELRLPKSLRRGD